MFGSRCGGTLCLDAWLHFSWPIYIYIYVNLRYYLHLEAPTREATISVCVGARSGIIGEAEAQVAEVPPVAPGEHADGGEAAGVVVADVVEALAESIVLVGTR